VQRPFGHADPLGDLVHVSAEVQGCRTAGLARFVKLSSRHVARRPWPPALWRHVRMIGWVPVISRDRSRLMGEHQDLWGVRDGRHGRRHLTE
jgi:hypothetical protein